MSTTTMTLNRRCWQWMSTMIEIYELKIWLNVVARHFGRLKLFVSKDDQKKERMRENMKTFRYWAGGRTCVHALTKIHFEHKVRNYAKFNDINTLNTYVIWLHIISYFILPFYSVLNFSVFSSFCFSLVFSRCACVSVFP